MNQKAQIARNSAEPGRFQRLREPMSRESLYRWEIWDFLTVASWFSRMNFQCLIHAD